MPTHSDYRTDGKIDEQDSLYGTKGNTSFSLDLDYLHNSGIRVNNDLSSVNWSTTIKQKVTPQDTAMVIVEYEDYHSGDNFQYFDNSHARPNYHFNEQAQPNAVGFWHHEWSPGIHTLAMATGWQPNSNLAISPSRTTYLSRVRRVMSLMDSAFRLMLRLMTELRCTLPN